MMRHYHLKEINIAMMKGNTEKMGIIRTTMMDIGREMTHLGSVSREDQVTVAPVIRGKGEDDGTTTVCDAQSDPSRNGSAD